MDESTGPDRGGRPGTDPATRTDGGDGRTVHLSVPDADCASCAGTIRDALDDVAGVRSTGVDVTAGTVTVTYDPAVVDRGAVVATVEGAGYHVEDGGEDGTGARDRDAGSDRAPGEGASGWRDVLASEDGLSVAAGAVLLAAGLVVRWGPVADSPVATVGGVGFSLSALLFLAAAGVAGRETVWGGLADARRRALGIDLLVTVAILAEVAASLAAPETELYVEAATLAVLFGVAELLEDAAMARARGSLRALLELAPREARVERDGEERIVPAEDVAVGETVRVRPGERVPLDGVVREGESAVDEAPVTGESVPAEKAAGDEVYAGTVNQDGFLAVEVTAPAEASTVARVADLVRRARAEETERERFVDRFASVYTPVMVALAVGMATVPPLAWGADWRFWFVAGITTLVLACPCAFAISTPVSVVSAITSAARNGVLVDGGTTLESLGDVEAVALDKTGTLTEGELEVTDVVPLGDHDREAVLRAARGLEARSEHPIAAAVVERAAAAGVEPAAEVSAFERLGGRGVRASLGGEAHYAGAPELFDELGFDLEHAHAVDATGPLATEVRDRCEREGCLDLVADTIPRLQDEGKTVLLVGTDEELYGVVAVADAVRADAAAAVAALRERGLHTVMLTGDNERTAAAVAAQVGVDDYRASLLPEEKVDAVESVADEQGPVAMVGDGVNDAPALATAHVGVAMGAAGSDAALESADVALLGDDLDALPYLFELADRTGSVIRQNVWSSLGAKLLLVAGVPLGLVSVALAVLAGDAGMTVAVTGNAMRLSRLEPE